MVIVPLPVAEDLRGRFADLLKFTAPETRLEVLEQREHARYTEQRVRFRGRDGDVPAFLLLPALAGSAPAVVALHQHHSEWHFGKSEIAGRAGSPYQAFGPALARAGVVVLAPDAVGFEDRRRSGPGTDPRPDDRLQYLNEMAYRLVRGDLLATVVLADTAAAISALRKHPAVDPSRLGVLGHSYGGNMALLVTALDERVGFACASGAACTYRRRMASGTGLELAHVIPGILEVGDIDDVVALIAPRPLLLISASRDPYSADASDIERAARRAWAARGAPNALEHVRYDGDHALTGKRSEQIIRWITSHAGFGPTSSGTAPGLQIPGSVPPPV